MFQYLRKKLKHTLRRPRIPDYWDNTFHHTICRSLLRNRLDFRTWRHNNIRLHTDRQPTRGSSDRLRPLRPPYNTRRLSGRPPYKTHRTACCPLSCILPEHSPHPRCNNSTAVHNKRLLSSKSFLRLFLHRYKTNQHHMSRFHNWGLHKFRMKGSDIYLHIR